jgi:hypothetical protein
MDKKEYLTYKVLKPVAKESLWRKSTKNHFICSRNETEEHIRAKFERWLYWLKNGADVYCELTLNETYNSLRPDLIIVTNGGVFIEEIVHSEGKESIEIKKKKYPFTITVINTK